MRIIAQSTLRAFSIKYPHARKPLGDWYRFTSNVTWQSPADIKTTFRSADILPDNRVVFNIGGNDFKLVVKIEYAFQTVYVRFVGTQADYDRINATTI